MLIALLWIFGIDGLTSDTVTDINVYDTYFVVATTHLIVLITTLMFFAVYLIRMLGRNFKNLTVNLIFMVSDITLIVVFTFLISMVNAVREVPSATEYAPAGGGMVENAGNGWNNAYYILVAIQLILILLLTVSGIKTGYNHSRK